MAHAIDAHGLHDAAPHCEACAARASRAERAAGAGFLQRSRSTLARWFNVLNGTPVADISRGDLGSIRRLAEAWDDEDLTVRQIYELAGVKGGERFSLRSGR